MVVLKTPHIVDILLALLVTGCGEKIAMVIDATDTGGMPNIVDTATASLSGSEAETSSDTDTPSDSESDTSRPPLPYMIGADISYVNEQEDFGIVFTENGEPIDMLTQLKSHGINFIRLRLFKDSDAPLGYQYADYTRAEPYCDLSHTFAMAKRIKAVGIGFFLSIRYADTWTDPENQPMPADWVGMNMDELEVEVYEYTSGVLGAFESDNTMPDMVQIGNEITNGMLDPVGYDLRKNPEKWDNLARLLNAAIRAVNDIDPNIVTVLHLDLIDQLDWTVSWMQKALSRDVEFDALAFSAYNRWHGELATWETTLLSMAERFPNHGLLIAQYAGNHLALNDFMINTLHGMGTFAWEVTTDGDWGDGLYDAPIETAGEATPRETLLLFDEIAEMAAAQQQ
jgi:arabinogalactan endo-1,4-beta-galactosidase